MKKLLVKNVKRFVREHWVLYAQDGEVSFYISLRCGNIDRFKVSIGEHVRKFRQPGDAVKFFNEQVALYKIKVMKQVAQANKDKQWHG